MRVFILLLPSHDRLVSPSALPTRFQSNRSHKQVGTASQRAIPGALQTWPGSHPTMEAAPQPKWESVPSPTRQPEPLRRDAPLCQCLLESTSGCCLVFPHLLPGRNRLLGVLLASLKIPSTRPTVPTPRYPLCARGDRRKNHRIGPQCRERRT